MMKKNYSILASIVIMFSYASAQEYSLDKILSEHYRVMGFDNLSKISTIVMTGTMIQNDAMPVKIIRERPDKYLMEFDIQDLTSYQGYDGITAWWTTPWTGNPKPQLMPEDRAVEMRSRAIFDGLLYNWKAKGHTVELISMDTVEESPVFKLKVTKKDSSIEFLFIDATGFTLHKRLYKRMVRGNEVAFENFYRDYRSVEGVLFPYIQDTYVGGQPYNSLQFDLIELNKQAEASIFLMSSH